MQLYFSARTSGRHSTAETIAHHSSWLLMALIALGVGFSSRARDQGGFDTQSSATMASRTADSAHTRPTVPGGGLNPPTPSSGLAWPDDVSATCGRSRDLGLIGAVVQTILAPKWCELAPLATIGARVVPSSSSTSTTWVGPMNERQIMGDADGLVEAAHHRGRVIASTCSVPETRASSERPPRLRAETHEHANSLGALALGYRRRDASR